jgi:hypothetical protein
LLLSSFLVRISTNLDLLTLAGGGDDWNAGAASSDNWNDGGAKADTWNDGGDTTGAATSGEAGGNFGDNSGDGGDFKCRGYVYNLSTEGRYHVLTATIGAASLATKLETAQPTPVQATMASVSTVARKGEWFSSFHPICTLKHGQPLQVRLPQSSRLHRHLSSL